MADSNIAALNNRWAAASARALGRTSGTRSNRRTSTSGVDLSTRGADPWANALTTTTVRRPGAAFQPGAGRFWPTVTDLRISSGRIGAVSPAPERLAVTIGGREFSVSNLDKVMYPVTGFNKAELIDYYAKIAPVMLPHLAGRPVTVKRFPNGVESQGFIEKNVPRHAPDWLRTAVLGRKTAGKDTNTYAIVDDLASLVWFANLAAIEFHTPMWRLTKEGTPEGPDLIVFDLDPGEGATIVECCQVAGILRSRLAADSIELLAKTSGSKGLQLYGRIATRGWTGDEINNYAHEVALSVEEELPGLVVSRMTRALRTGKIFIDWSQNNPAKTTVTPYSLRALPKPSVSTPVTWQEVTGWAEGAALDGGRVIFSPTQVLERVASRGDLLAEVLG